MVISCPPSYWIVGEMKQTLQNLWGMFVVGLRVIEIILILWVPICILSTDCIVFVHITEDHTSPNLSVSYSAASSQPDTLTREFGTYRGHIRVRIYLCNLHVGNSCPTEYLCSCTTISAAERNTLRENLCYRKSHKQGEFLLFWFTSLRSARALMCNNKSTP